MRRKFIIVLIIGVIPIIMWIYKTRLKSNNNLIVYKQSMFSNYFYVKEAAIIPNLGSCANDPFLIIIVTSYVGHTELRSAHRRAMPLDHLKKYNTIRIFLLAQLPPNEKYITQEAINDESNKFEDILQGTFIENYRNLTYKHLMGLQWASQYCNKTSYILKVDDDTVFNFEATITHLQSLRNNKNFILGYMLNNTVPQKNSQNKWFVTLDEYSYSIYPKYVSGWYYITTPKTAGKIVEIAQYNKYFWIDDIFVTGILTEALGIELQHVPDNFWLEYYELLECCIRDMIVKNISCNHIVGPNGGRNNLILEFSETLKNCESKCTNRSEKRELKNDCILNKDRSLFGDGKPDIELLKL